MPTVLRSQGYTVVIRTRDHLPPHVHVRKGGGRVRIDLEARLRIRNPVGLSPAEIAEAWWIVRQHHDEFLAKWRDIHGPHTGS